MVLAHKIDEWLEKDKAREKSREEELHKRVRALVDEWLAKYGLPPTGEVEKRGLTETQLPAARHVVDVVANGKCTDPDCPYRNDDVPDFIRK